MKNSYFKQYFNISVTIFHDFTVFLLKECSFGGHKMMFFKKKTFKKSY